MTDRLEFANILRGIAALVVVLFVHLGGVFFASPAAVASLTWAPQFNGGMPSLFSFMHQCGLNYGHLGVALFFLISGFVIPFHKLIEENISLKAHLSELTFLYNEVIESKSWEIVQILKKMIGYK